MTTPEDNPADDVEAQIGADPGSEPGPEASVLPPEGQTEGTDVRPSDVEIAPAPSPEKTEPRGEGEGEGEPESEPQLKGETALEDPAEVDSTQTRDGTSARRPSSHPIPSMLGSGLETRSWLLELPEFEGPLDLLLHLVRRHELDILDIPTSFVTEKYLEYLAFMEAMDLEVAGDYLVMAATLAYLKSRELVPTEPSEEDEVAVSDAEGPDPREELIARLLEYQKFRAAASDLDKLPVSGRDVFSRGGEVELPPVDPGLAPLTLFRLAEAYHRVLDRARINKSHDVVIETCSVAQRMHQLTTILIESSKVEFESLFLGRTWSSEAELRSMLVVTLMSVLELTKLGVIFVRQEVGGESIVIERKATPEEAKRAIAGYDESVSFGAPKPGVAEDPASGEGPDSPPAAGAQTPPEDAESNSDA